MIKKTITNILALIFNLITTSFLASNYCFATNLYNDSKVTTNDIILEVEKSLFFNDNDKSTIDLLQNQFDQKTQKGQKLPKSDITINAGENEELTNDAIEIKVTENKNKINLDNRIKEKMAYNATLNDQHEVAIELYKQIINEEPNNNYALFSLAITYQKIGQYKQAKALYYQLLKNNPENKEEIISNILTTLSEESPKEALYLISRIANANPNSSYILMQVALAYDNVKNYNKAEEFIQKAIDISPERIDYIYNLAIIYDKAQNYSKSLETYLEVVRKYNNSEYKDLIPINAVKERIETIKYKI